MELSLQSSDLSLMLHHPGDSTVERAGRVEPGSPAGVIAAVCVAVVDRGAVLVPGQYVADRGRANAPDLPDTEGAGDGRHGQRVRRDRAAKCLPGALA